MKKYSTCLLIITLIGLALRLYNLTYHSLWFDEAISVHWARQSVPRILEVGLTLVEDRLPPLYYLFLKGWTNFFGFSEVSVRSLSVFWGVLLVPIIATIAAMLFNRRVAVVTALLVALNPFLIWYSQETRMYAQAVLFSALSVWAFLKMPGVRGQGSGVRSLVTEDRWQMAESKVDDTSHPPSSILHPPSSIYTLLFMLFAIAGLYTHLYTSFLLPALGLWLIFSYPRQWRLWLLFVFCGLVIALAFAPLAIATWRFSGEATPGNPISGLGQRAWWLLQAFTVWKAPLPDIFQVAIPLFYILLAVAAHLKPSNTHPPHPLLLVSLLLISPFVIANLLLLRNHLAFFGERYFIVMVPWLLLLVALGAERGSEWLSLRVTKKPSKWRTVNSQFTIHYSLFTILLLLTILPIPGQWSVPAAKEAWRQGVAYLAEHAAANHGILIHPDWVRYPFQFYFRGPGQTYAAFSTVTPETPLDGPLRGVVDSHPVIWLIQSHLDGPDPRHLVEQWFDRRYPLVTELYPPGISLKGYAPGYQLDALPHEATPINIQFENGLQLVGYEADSIVSATNQLFHPPSGWAHVTLYWTASKPVRKDVAPLVNLVGPEGVWGASLERANDALKLYPTSRWSVGDTKIVRHDVDVNLNPLTPPGVYQLVVGLHGYAQEQYPLAQIEVRP
jgi:4-amino-4-deoxy-L-arabinose transferase-like glycosyltransferase